MIVDGVRLEQRRGEVWLVADVSWEDRHRGARHPVIAWPVSWWLDVHAERAAWLDERRMVGSTAYEPQEAGQ